MPLVVILVLLIVVTLFAVQNSVVVTVIFFLWRAEASLAVIITVCFVSGALVAALALAPGIYRLRSQERKLRKELAEIQAISNVTYKPDDLR
ncbi:MAG: lipopolysaccharide assembly LapA domain-containing protein [Steroidobacteraceae bacterium]